MSQLWRQREELQRRNVKVVVVTFESHQVNLPSITDEGHRFPYHFDLEKRLYHYYGMEKAGFRDVWGLRTLKTYFRLLLQGKKLLKSQGDVYQRGGDVLIDPDGKIRFHHISIGPGDRPSLDAVLEVIDAGLRQSDI